MVEGFPKLQLGDNQAGQSPESIGLSRCEFSRLHVNHADSAQRGALLGNQRGSCVKTNLGFCCNKGIIEESIILRGIGYLHNLVGMQDRVCAKRYIPRRFMYVD